MISLSTVEVSPWKEVSTLHTKGFNIEKNVYAVMLSEIKQGTELCIQCEYNYVNRSEERERMWASRRK